MAFFSGKFGVIKFDTVARALDNWTLDSKTDTSDVTNFTSGGWQELVSGIFSAEITASGPYSGASGLTQGAVVALSLDVNADGTSPAPFTGNAIIESVKLDTSVKDAVRVNYSLKSTGAWTIPI